MAGFQNERPQCRILRGSVHYPRQLSLWLSYNNRSGYFRTMSRLKTLRRLSPHTSQVGHFGRLPAFRATGTRASRGKLAKGRMVSERQRRLFLTALGGASGFEAACIEAGISPGAAVAERVRNPRFAREWDRHLEACIVKLETLLVEKAALALTRGFPENDTRDKWLVALVQWLLEPRRAQAPQNRQPVLPSARNAAPAQREARDEAADAEKVAVLIERASARLAEAEAQMARDGLATDGPA